MDRLSFEWIAAPPPGAKAPQIVKLFTIWQVVPSCARPLAGRGGHRHPQLHAPPGPAYTWAPMFITKPFVRDRKIRFALVGCGRISANHFEALERHADRAELVGVCDIDPQALCRAE